MSLFLHTDITAVTLYENYILAGIGSHVNVFSKTNYKHLVRRKVLKNQKIYGFKSSKNDFKMLVFGGKQFAVIWLEGAEGEEVLTLEHCDAIRCDDWLHAMIWTSRNEVAALTAHNVVQIWNIETKELTSKYISRNNSILYSGFLLPLDEDVLVFAGTVFSEVIVHCCSNDETMHLLKGHRGVIFSIACDPEKEMIVTTSDDRSVRIWGPNNCVSNDRHSKLYWQSVEIACRHEVYGHSARVMRCVIADHCVVSVGEDSAICYWSFDGKLEKKSLSHQHGSIWSVAAERTCLVTGGGDGSIIIHPPTAIEHGDNVTITVNNPKRLAFTARGNIVILCVNDDVVYHDVDTNASTVVCKLNQNCTYKLLSTSSCKQIISIMDMCGNLNVFVENCKENNLRNLVTANLEIGKVLSMQWAGNRHLVVCCDSGDINVLVANGSQIETYAKFVLPNCKERWLTAAAVGLGSVVFAFGDRCGNIHFYSQNQADPIKTIRKVHGRYGPTSITIKNDEVITTGRDGTIKHFSFGKCIKYMSCVDLNFQWVEKFLDKSESYICGFQERTFVVYDLKSRTTLLEVPCGGGHRAWDAIRSFSTTSNKLEELITLVYLKNSAIHKVTFPLSKMVSQNVISGSHIRETNCLTTYRPTVDDKSRIIFISGGEDTTLRISSMYNTEMRTFRDECIFKNLSNVRCLKVVELFQNRLLVVSGGGRAQICIKILQFIKEDNCLDVKSENIVDHLIKGTDKERKGDQNWRNRTVDFDPETRIMCLEIVELCNDYLIFAGCSDALLRIYKLSLTENSSIFLLIASIKYHSTCILTIHAFKLKGRQLLATATTTGEIAFWVLFATVSEITNDLANMEPVFVTRTNKSGINSFATEVLNDSFLMATGGDDNAIHLQILKFDSDDVNRLCVSFRCVLNSQHSGLVSGLCLFDRRYLLSTSTDQRVTLMQWSLNQNGLDSLFMSQAYSDVPDIHGLDIVHRTLGYITICVYGKGFEIMKIPILNS